MKALRLSQYPMNSGQATMYLDISLGHLYNLIWRRRGPRHIRYCRQLRFRACDLDDWIACRSVAVAPNMTEPGQAP
jgi:hypothetical protein